MILLLHGMHLLLLNISENYQKKLLKGIENDTSKRL